jgi:hypothetical protein
LLQRGSKGSLNGFTGQGSAEGIGQITRAPSLLPCHRHTGTFEVWIGRAGPEGPNCRSADHTVAHLKSWRLKSDANVHTAMSMRGPWSRRTLLRMLVVTSAGGGVLSVAQQPERHGPSNCDHVAWVSESLKRMQSAQPGTTRDQLMRVFTTEGGIIFSGLQRTFVSRDCPYFKVDITFRRTTPPDGGAPGVFDELGSDVIVTISRPYLQFSIMD